MISILLGHAFVMLSAVLMNYCVFICCYPLVKAGKVTYIGYSVRPMHAGRLFKRFECTRIWKP